jgi:uncharacterized ferritin-like protein (DUF455 family)
MIHSLAHIESYAIDLSWDILVRFRHGQAGAQMPEEFFADWLRIAAEEARHYTTWENRLVEFESHYGALPGHDGLWEAADETSDGLEYRLAIVHTVLEGRGLDTYLVTRDRMNAAGDEKSVGFLDEIYEDEITHVGSAMRWFRFIQENRTDEVGQEAKKSEDFEEFCISRFHQIVRDRFHGLLKPPFNDDGRAKAGMTPEWYMPLTTKKE